MEMTGRVSTSPEQDRYSDIIFWTAAFFLFFWALGYRGIWASEDRWAEITREMFLTGDFFHPTINGVSYFDKPLISYWLIALASAISGRLDEWIIRLPSAVSGLIVLWATVCLGSRLWSKKVGITAGWILLTSYGILLWARTASSDMENLAAIILAVAWYWARRDKQNFFAWLVFYLVCFIGSQTKGLGAVVVPVIAVLPDLIRKRGWRRMISFSHIFAFSVGLSLYFIPFIFSMMTHGEGRADGLYLVFRENILRYFHPFDHKEPFYVYLYYIPELLLPWTPLVLSALWAAFASFKRLDQKTRWLAEAVALIFLFFTCSGSRRSYYILPVLPFCALLTSVFLYTDDAGKTKRLGLALQTGFLVMLSLAEILSPVIWPILKERFGFIPPAGLKLSGPVLGSLALFSLIFVRMLPDHEAAVKTNQKIAGLVVSAVILMGGFFCWQQLNLEAYRGEKPFALELKTHIKGLSAKQIAFYPKTKANILFYLNMPEPVSVLPVIGSAGDFLKSCKGGEIIVTERKYIHELSSVLPEDLLMKQGLSEKLHPWDLESGEKLVELKIYRKEK